MNKEEVSAFYAKQLKNHNDAYNVMKKWIAYREGCYVMEVLEYKEFNEPLKFKYLQIAYNFKAPKITIM